MRGKVKFPFELKFDIEWEVLADLDGEVCEGATGVLSYTDVSPLNSGVDGSAKVSYELSERFTSSPTAADRDRVQGRVGELKTAVDTTLQSFLEDVKKH